MCRDVICKNCVLERLDSRIEGELFFSARPARRRIARTTCRWPGTGGHAPSWSRQQSDAYRRQGHFSAPGMELTPGGRTPASARKRFSESDFDSYDASTSEAATATFAARRGL